MSVHSSVVHFVRLAFAALIVLAGCGSCVSAPRESLEPDEVRDALSIRAGGASERLDAHVLAGLDELALPRPTSEECADPRSAGYWRACALAWNPAVRAARRDLERARAARRTAGSFGTIDAEYELMDFSDPGRESKLSTTFDLLSLFGLGPARLAREVAQVDVRRAHSRLEGAVWAANFDVERARVRLAASKSRQARLAALFSQVSAHSTRFEVLERRGRLSEAEAEMIGAVRHEIEHAISVELGREAELRADMARVCGLPFDHQAWAEIGAEALLETRAIPATDSERRLLEQDPALRELTLEFAQAEVQVRRVAADQWGMARGGPQLTIMPSEILVGGLLDLSIPWTGSLKKELRIARAEREAARERVEDALHQALARASSLRTIEHEAHARASEHATGMDEAAESAWQAVNARLRAGSALPGEWIRSLRDRIAPLVGLADAREQAALAALDLAQACGVAPHAAEVSP